MLRRGDVVRAESGVMNQTSTFRRVAATLTTGSFSVAALMGILALLRAGDFGDNEARVLLTTLVVGSASICVLCYLATAGSRWAPLGALGGVVAVLPTVTALLLVWSDWDGGDLSGMLKTFGVGVVLAVTLAQLCLLLALTESRFGPGPVLWATAAMAVLLAAIVCGLILGAVDEGVWQLLGIVAILDVLGTLVTIASAKFGGREETPAAPSDSRLRPVLSYAQSALVQQQAQATGRTPDELVSEAVEQYLNAQTAAGTRASG